LLSKEIFTEFVGLNHQLTDVLTKSSFSHIFSLKYIKLSPTRTQYLEVEYLLLGDPVYSVFKYPTI